MAEQVGSLLRLGRLVDARGMPSRAFVRAWDALRDRTGGDEDAITVLADKNDLLPTAVGQAIPGDSGPVAAADVRGGDVGPVSVDATDNGNVGPL